MLLNRYKNEQSQGCMKNVFLTEIHKMHNAMQTEAQYACLFYLPIICRQINDDGIFIR